MDEDTGGTTSRRHMVRVRGLRLAAVETGDPAEPCVILLHGLGMSKRSFEPLMEHLGEHRRVIAVDLPGCGESASLVGRGISRDQVIELLWEALSELHVSGCALVGHSLGAQVATRMAAEHPERVTQLFLVAPCPDPTMPSMFRTAARLFVDGYQEPWGLIRYAVVDYLRARPRRMWSVFERSVRTLDLNLLGQVKVPTVVVRGSRDRISTEGATRVLTENIPHARGITLDDGTHGLPFQSAAQVARIIMQGGDDDGSDPASSTPVRVATG